MLVLSRRVNEKVVLPSLQVTVNIVAIKSGVVRLGFEAPRDVPVLRQELHDRTAQWQPPTSAAPEPLRGGDQQALRSTSAGLGLALLQLHAGQYAAAALTLEQLQHHCQVNLPTLQEPLAPPAPAPKKRKALLVEDNPNERELLARLLRGCGIEVDTVGDGDDALEYLQTHRRPDVILLDMGLPRCDGPTTVREIRRDPNYAGLPIFAVTGQLREDFDLGEGPTGVDRWFHKPLDPSELVRDVGSLPIGTSCTVSPR
jgi:carbon storage regulator CsrA